MKIDNSLAPAILIWNGLTVEMFTLVLLSLYIEMKNKNTTLCTTENLAMKINQPSSSTVVKENIGTLTT